MYNAALINYSEHYHSSRPLAAVLPIRCAVHHSLRSVSLLSIARLDCQVRNQVRRRLLDLRRLAASSARRVSARHWLEHAYLQTFRFGVRVLAEYDVKQEGDATNNDDSTHANDTCQERAKPPVTWMLLNNLNRVSETVKKVSQIVCNSLYYSCNTGTIQGLLLCYVVWPANVAAPGTNATDEQYNEILSNLSQFSVREVKFGRWKPSKTRN